MLRKVDTNPLTPSRAAHARKKGCNTLGARAPLCCSLMKTRQCEAESAAADLGS
jgi:hypothetical protein